MNNWEYCEVEVTTGKPLSSGSANLTVFRADGKHETLHGNYGEIIAKLGAQGWELATSSFYTLEGLIRIGKITYIFKRPLRA